MHKFFRNLIISAIIVICGIALYQVRLNAKASSGTSISSVTGYALSYTGTSYTPMVVFNGIGAVVAGDLIKVYLSTSSSSGSLGSYSANDTLTVAHQFGPAPRTGTINIGTGFESFTGTTLYIHAFVTDSAGANTGYGMQAITFIPNSGPNRTAIYSGIHDTLISSGINNNFNGVTSGNVTSYSGLFFAKMSGSNELGRITFPISLDLTDSGVQTLLQNLGSGDVMDMQQGRVKFSPGAVAAMNSGASITMNFGSGSMFVSGINNSSAFTVLSNTGAILDASSIMSSITGIYAGDSGYINFSASHFTEFDLKPTLTSVTIRSSAGTGAWSGDTVYISFTGSDMLTGVTVTIAGNTANLQGGGPTRIASGILITGGTVGTDIPFIINFRNNFGISGDQVTMTTSGSVKYYNSGAGGDIRQTIYTSIGLSLSGQGILNNFNLVNTGNVTSFSGLYFAKMSGSNELGRITFSTGLDLTDTGTQNFLSGELPNSIGMDQGQIRFNPGTGFVGKMATLKMNIPDIYSGFLGSMNANSFVVREGSGGAITGNSVITSVYSSGACTAGSFGCSLYINVSHFTQFDIKPILTQVHIQSSYTDPAYAASGHVVTLSFTGSEPLTGVTITINGQSISPLGGGTSRYGNFTVTGGTASSLITFTINYSDMANNTGATVTGTNDSSSVTVSNNPPSTPTITTASQTVSGTTITIVGIADTGNTVQIRSGATILATGTSNGSYSISTPVVEGTNTLQAYAVNIMSLVSSGSTGVIITRDSIAPTGGVSFLSGAYTRATTTTINITSSETVTYTLTGNIPPATGSATNTGITRNVTLMGADGTYGVYVILTDLAGNKSAMYNASIYLDTLVPTATGAYSTTSPTNQDVIVTLTGYSETLTGINTTTHTFTGNGSFTFTFSDLAGNTGSTTAIVSRIDKTPITSTITYAPTGATNQNVIATVTGFNKTGVTVSGANPYTFTTNGTYIFSYRDVAGNTGSNSLTITGIDKTVPTASVDYSTASLTSGNVIATLTGYSESLTGINATGYTFTGNGSFTFTFSDLVGNTGSVTATVSNIDKTAPTIAITSHTNNQQVTGSIITLAGTASDANGIASILVNSVTAVGTTSRSKTGTLAGGANVFSVTGTDAAGNTANTGITVIRINYLTNVLSTILSGTSVQIGFTTDVSATGFVKYGTNSGSLGTIASSGTATTHAITINGLTTATTYYYQTYALNGGYTGNLSSIASFITPNTSITTSNITGTTTTSGSVQIGGATTTGATFTSTGTLVVYGVAATDYISLPVSGLVITAGSAWNDILEGPASTTFSGTAPSYSSYTHQPTLTYTIGNTSTSLTLSGQVVTITIYVGTSFNGKIMRIYKSTDSGVTYPTFVNTCTVSAGVCSFTSNGFSTYTMLSQDSTSSGGGGGGGSSTEDTGTIIIEKESGSIVGSTYSVELNNAYLYAYDIGITTMNTIQKANMDGALIRAHMAKMMVNYAVKVLGKAVDTTKTGCIFNDLADQTTEMKNYTKRACQLGLMGVGMTNFEPDTEVTRAQFGTVLSRAMRGDRYNTGTVYYLNHLNALKENNIITNTTPDLKEIRGYVMLMLYRAQ